VAQNCSPLEGLPPLARRASAPPVTLVPVPAVVGACFALEEGGVTSPPGAGAAVPPAEQAVSVPVVHLWILRDHSALFVGWFRRLEVF